MIILWTKDGHMFVPNYSNEHSKLDCAKALIEWNKTIGAGTYIKATNQNKEEVLWGEIEDLFNG